MTRLAYFDCFSGISGDMTLGALLDGGGDRAVLDATVEALGLTREVSIEVRHEQRGHLGGTRVAVDVREGPGRTVPELREVVAAAGLPAVVRARSLDAIDRLAAVEARIHDTPEAELHLHELGGADTLVDLVGTFWLLDSMAVTAVHASPLPAPRGLMGDMPLPAPAAMGLLAGTGAVLEPSDAGVELVTPTGAAILAVAATFSRPAMSLDAVGYGIGGRERPGNALAVWLGSPVLESGEVEVLETNLDDVTPEHLAALLEDLMAAGALDVTVTPLLMKKGRPGHAVAVMAEIGKSPELARLVLGRSPALGLRVSRVGRVLAGRRQVEVQLPEGTVRVKVKELEGRAVEVSAEYEDCRRLAGENGDVRTLARLAEAAARQQLGLR